MPQRVTPAYAGKTFWGYNELFTIWGHPRVCGEDRNILPRVEQIAASPPRMRGRRDLMLYPSHLLSVTPAYAGKTVLIVSTTLLMVSHPRVCGEDRVCASDFRRRNGSPPRMRGRRQRLPPRDRRHGITPAYAGKTKYALRDASRRADHPRVCGERQGLAHEFQRRSGSPPRVRGALAGVDHRRIFRRITPAYAGKVTPDDVNEFGVTDHPRVCGEGYRPPEKSITNCCELLILRHSGKQPLCPRYEHGRGFRPCR